MKFLIMGPASLALLIRVRIQEAIARRRSTQRQQMSVVTGTV
jgi:hypothetical protein